MHCEKLVVIRLSGRFKPVFSVLSKIDQKEKMRKILLTLFVFAPVLMWAQEMRTVEGKVLSKADGQPLPGVSVFLDDTTIGVLESEGVVSNYNAGTIADFDGNFSIKIPKQTTKLTFSIIGYKTISLDLDSRDYYEVKMAESTELLEEVVVTGYQEIKSRKLTAAVSKIEAKDVIQQGSTSVDQMLSGQIAGMETTTTSGAPGAPVKIRIRGTTSFSGSQDPLWVLDGMPLTDTDLPNMEGKDVDQLVNTPIAGINPSDIESITVLKDASATAIYGARAANGVIVITTKKGKKGKTKVEVSSNWMFNFKPDFSRLDLLNSDEKVDFELYLASRKDLFDPTDVDNWMAVKDNPYRGAVGRILRDANEYAVYQKDGFSALSTETQNAINKLRSVDTDWSDELYRTGISQNHNVAISGGTEKSQHYFSLGYFDELGTTIGASNNRLNLTLKSKYQIANKVKFGVSVFGTKTTTNSYLTGGMSFANPARYARIANPYLRVYDDEDNYVYDKEFRTRSKDIDFNIIEELDNTKNELNTYNLTAIFDLDVQLFDNLSFKSQYGVVYTKSDNEKFADKNTFYTKRERERSNYGTDQYLIAEGYGITKDFKEDIFQWNWKNMLTYSNTFAEKHELDFLVGNELRADQEEEHTSNAFQYDKDLVVQTPILFPEDRYERYLSPYVKSVYENAFVSFFSTLSYTYDRRYSFFGSVRTDESNLFGVDRSKRRLPIYSTGLSWNLTEENWMKQFEWLNMFKLRASYGLQGNIDKETSPEVIAKREENEVLPGNMERMLDVNRIPNEHLRWEKTATTDFGVDMAMFGNRIVAGVDLYYRYSTDLIAPKQLAPETGFINSKVNWGEMSNKGIELSLMTRNIVTKDFKWTTTFNIFKNINKVEKLKIELNSEKPYPSIVGKDINTRFAYPTKGLDENGLPLFEKGGKTYTVQEYFGLVPMFGDFPESELTDEEKVGLFEEVGSTDPQWSGGITNRFSYKNWTLTVAANFKIKQWRQVTPFYSIDGIERGQNMQGAIHSVWTPEDKAGEYPAYLGPTAFGGERAMEINWMRGAVNISPLADLDIWYKEMSYIRINFIRLAYRMPATFVNRIGFNSVELSCEAKNPFVFGTNYSGYFDPETYGNIYSQPIPKSILLGIKLSF